MPVDKKALVDLMFADNGKESFPRTSNGVGNSYDRVGPEGSLGTRSSMNAVFAI